MNLYTWMILFLSVFASQAALAQKGSGGALSGRQKERDDQKWSFSSYLGNKGKLKEQDLLYRFYTSSDKKNSARVEPLFFGLGGVGDFTEKNSLETLPEEMDSSEENLPENNKFTGIGYGGSVYFNNFISSLGKFTTPNFVLGMRGEQWEEKKATKSPVRLTWGPSIRFFARHQQDTAIFLNYLQHKRQVFQKEYDAWEWEAQGILYLGPGLGAEGSYVFSEKQFKGKPSELATRKAYSYGGFFELGMFRFGGRFSRDSFVSKENPADSLTETRRILYLALSI